MDKFYITTPIYYVNSKPHIGHAYTTIVADILTRFHKLFAEETWFLTGTDEHGEKIAQKAEGEKISPQKFADAISQEFRDLWPELHIAHDQFIRTTDQEHKKIVHKALSEIHDKGYVYRDDYTGLYCVGCERYLDTDELNGDGLCPDHQQAPQEISETNYFFKMSLFQERLLEHIRENPDWIYPETYRQEVLGFLKEPLKDLCLSRPKSRVEWGVELPFDDNFVCYVWFDALLNYVSALGWTGEEKFEKFWPHVHHILAKDIVKAHCIYWPCMLMALEIPVPKQFIIHGYWINQDSKISKSLGNAVSPLDMKEKYSADALRFYLAAAMSFGRDANFSEENFLERYNADLANNLGNLISRTLTLTVKNFDGQIPENTSLTPREEELKKSLASLVEGIKNAIKRFELHKAAQGITEMGREINRYIDEFEPWKLAKEESKRDDLARVLGMQCTGIKLIAAVLSPFMPETSQKIFKAFGIKKESINLNDLNWDDWSETGKVTKIPPLFPRASQAN